jgi:solute carrier family 13 (sodium-dependent dicarboxylate transporter), member 2/3/5
LGSYRKIFLYGGPLIFGFSYLLMFLEVLDVRGPMIAILIWMLFWWTSRVVPIALTSLIPIVVFPLLNILDLKSTALNYSNPVIFLFFGGFVLGIAIEKWGLHKRIALSIIKASGVSPSRVVFGSMLATAFLSMWISNTAATLMMLPIGLSILTLISANGNLKVRNNLSVALLLGIAYSANIGGMATLIGTPPNLVLAGMAEDALGIEIRFSTWFFFAIPLVLVLFTLVFLINTRFLFPLRNIELPRVGELIELELKKLGKQDIPEKRVAIIFSITALAWVFRSYLNQLTGLEKLSDPIIAIASAIGLFLVPSRKGGKPIMVWRDAQRIPWEILLLFGGGLAIAQGMANTGIMTQIGLFIEEFGPLHLLGLVLLVTFFSVFLTEVMSNVALVSVFIPISFGLTAGLGLDGLGLSIPLTLGASCAFMFPISTPPNAIIYSSKRINMLQMAKSGLVLNLVSILVIAFYYWLLRDYFF